MIDMQKDVLCQNVSMRTVQPRWGVRAKLEVSELVEAESCKMYARDLAERRARFGIWKRLYGDIRDPLARVEAALMQHHPNPVEARELVERLNAAIPPEPK